MILTCVTSCRIDDAEQTLIIIKTTRNEVLGAFCDQPWGNRNNLRDREQGMYFGGGYSFVWNLGEKKELNIYGWRANQPEYFMAAPYDPDATVMIVSNLFPY